MKSKDKFRASNINMARAAVLQAEKVDNRTLDDEEVVEILSREVKRRKEAIAEFEKGNRQDLVEQTKSEIEILLEYLPKQLTEEEIADIVQQVVYETGANSIRDMGKVMSAAMSKLKGCADGTLVSLIVKQHLS
ncbi:putative protein YqeY [bioreactor metagenome]|uniref:GatB/YqeY domain-containing protein n=1 Tax=bioreactor metagenome TaxID=1076179 RepID=A0A645FS08_9ZZZZ